jgi:hypothetical protein
MDRQYSFQKLSQFSQGNIVLHDPASNTGAFLSRDVFLQISKIGLFGTKKEFLTLENLDGKAGFFQKLTQFSQGNHVIDAPAFF